MAVLVRLFRGRPVTIGRGVGKVEEKGRVGSSLLFDKRDAFVGEEIHRMARLVVNFTIVENLVAIKTAHVAVFQRDPIVKPLSG